MENERVPKLRNWGRPQVDVLVRLYAHTNQGHKANMRALYERFESQFAGVCTSSDQQLRKLIEKIREAKGTPAANYFNKWQSEQDAGIVHQHGDLPTSKVSIGGKSPKQIRQRVEALIDARKLAPSIVPFPQLICNYDEEYQTLDYAPNKTKLSRTNHYGIADNDDAAMVITTKPLPPSAAIDLYHNTAWIPEEWQLTLRPDQFNIHGVSKDELPTSPFILNDVKRSTITRDITNDIHAWLAYECPQLAPKLATITLALKTYASQNDTRGSSLSPDDTVEVTDLFNKVPIIKVTADISDGGWEEMIDQEGWEEMIDQQSGQTYYQHVETGETKWSLTPREDTGVACCGHVGGRGSNMNLEGTDSDNVAPGANDADLAATRDLEAQGAGNTRPQNAPGHLDLVNNLINEQPQKKEGDKKKGTLLDKIHSEQWKNLSKHLSAINQYPCRVCFNVRIFTSDSPPQAKPPPPPPPPTTTTITTTTPRSVASPCTREARVKSTSAGSRRKKTVVHTACSSTTLES